MAKKHKDQCRKRHRDRAERRRVEAKRRKTEANARLQGVPRKPRATDEASPSTLLHGMALAQPPSEGDVRAVEAALERLSQGGGDVAAEVRRWSPAATADASSEITIELRLLGLTTSVYGDIYALDPEDDDALDGEDLDPRDLSARAARLVVDALRHDERAARSLLVLWALEELLMDDLLLDRSLVEAVASRLDIAGDTETILDPLARGLPARERAAWYRARAEGRWEEDIGDLLPDAVEWLVSGRLADFAETAFRASFETRWRPPWSAASH